MKSSKLQLLRLEDRSVPAGWNNPWPDAQHLTVSFAPDGTAVGDRISTLNASLDSIVLNPIWRRELLRALQTWAVHGNINFGLVGDRGHAFGTSGSSQGDGRFGDLRFAGYAVAGNSLALSSPFDPMAGTWSGDIKLNLDADLNIGGLTGFDLYTVALHEAGHVLGLGHSLNPASPLYENYVGPRTGLIAEDIARLQALYGARTADLFEGLGGNETNSNASGLSLLTNPDGTLSQTVTADLTTITDRDVYSFSSGLLGGSAFLRLNVQGLSLLNAKISVQDQAGNILASAIATNPGQGNLTLAVNGLLPLHKYFIRVESAVGDVFGIGAYQLQLTRFPLVGAITGTLLNTLTGATAPIVSLLAQQDLHTNDTPLTATLIPPLFSQADSRFDFAYRGSISDSWDKDFYRLTAPTGATVLTAMAWSLPGANQLTPRIRVFNAVGQQLPVEAVTITANTHVVQVRGVTAGQSYFVDVEPGQAAGAGQVGDYFLGVDFGVQPLAISSLPDVELDQSHSIESIPIVVSRTRLVNFVLDIQTYNGQAATGTMAVVDPSGKVVFTLSASQMEPVSGLIGLRPGRYLIRINSSQKILARLRFAVLDDPIGPRPKDTTEDPSGDSTPTDADDRFYWTGRDDEGRGNYPSTGDSYVIV